MIDMCRAKVSSISAADCSSLAIPVDFVEPDAAEHEIEGNGAHDERHACRDRLVLDGGEDHRWPGHHVVWGSFTEIFVCRSATKWLRL